MLRKILRSAVLLLSGLLLAATALPDAAQARGGFYARGYGYGLLRPAYRPLAAIGLGGGFGYGYYGYPLDDSSRTAWLFRLGEHDYYARCYRHRLCIYHSL